MIKNVIFDMGNVLLNYDVERTLRQHCPNDEAIDIIRRELFESEDWLEGDRGNLNDDELIANANKRIPEQYHAAARACALGWSDLLTPIDGADEFIEAVKKSGRKVFVLSNASPRFYDYFPKFYDMSRFDGIVVSCDVHIIKPDRGIYEHILKKFDLDPAECIFIDDRKENADGARKVGINAVEFKNNYDEIKTMLGI